MPAPKMKRSVGRGDWSSWPTYEQSALGLPGQYWYPVMWSAQLAKKPVGVTLLGRPVVFYREAGVPYALQDRCPHRGVPLSYGTQEFPGTLTCPYHGWTFDLETGVLRAVITDGPDSPLCGKVGVDTYPVAERLGLVWVFIGDGEGEPPPIDDTLPSELRQHAFTMGGRIDVRRGGWRFAAENGFDEGHAKFLHRNSLWRIMKLMPTWSRTRVVAADEGWITRVQDEVHWEATFPGVGTWSGNRWWKRGGAQVLGGSPSKAPRVDPVIEAMDVPGNQSIRLPGLLRIVHPRFIHYEWYVPSTEAEYIYVQVFVQFRKGFSALVAKLRYLLFVRWVFHGQFTGQDRWMVEAMHAPPERLYRPDVSITRWRALCEQAPKQGQAQIPDSGTDDPITTGASDLAQH
jgi:phenylpropionate dioxygenase-like ring-hydroxylating dioxygenase large terminal subunit